MKLIDNLLNQITMYQLLLYYLIFLLVAALGLSLFGVLSYNPINLTLSSLFLVAVCWTANKLFAYVFEAPTNVESVYITALILALIITPAKTFDDIVFLAAAGGLAIASKYLLAVNKRHVFNPAAIAIALTSLGAGQSASWWVGTAWMLPLVLAGGLLLARKLRRFTLIGIATGTALIVTTVFVLVAGGDILANLQREVLSSALFFAMFVMLTEPATSPSTNSKRNWYGVIVGALFPPQLHIGTLYLTPEIALIAGNVFAYIVGPRAKSFLQLSSRRLITPDTVDFVFTPLQKFSYQPGQYMEFTLQHPHTDFRGARRYFTLASSPTEPDLRLGVKFYKHSSSYKKALLKVDGSTPLVAAQLGGDFVLPKDPNQKIAFIAGGIGVTPYRSMIKYLLDINQKRPISMLYFAKTSADFAYTDIFDEAAQKIGLQIIYVPTGHGGGVSEELIGLYVPDYKERRFYISGPHGMVVTAEGALRNLGVVTSKVKKDFFSGYA